MVVYTILKHDSVWRSEVHVKMIVYILCHWYTDYTLVTVHYDKVIKCFQKSWTLIWYLGDHFKHWMAGLKNYVRYVLYICPVPVVLLPCVHAQGVKWLVLSMSVDFIKGVSNNSNACKVHARTNLVATHTLITTTSIYTRFTELWIDQAVFDWKFCYGMPKQQSS